MPGRLLNGVGRINPPNAGTHAITHQALAVYAGFCRKSIGYWGIGSVVLWGRECWIKAVDVGSPGGMKPAAVQRRKHALFGVPRNTQANSAYLCKAK